MDTLPVVIASPARRLVEAFLAGRGERTLRAYRQDLDDFHTFVGAADLDDAAQLLLARGHGGANALALAYRAHLIERDLAAATVNRRLAALRSLVKLARTLGLVPWALEVPGLRAEPYRDTRGPGRAGLLRLLGVLEVRDRFATGRYFVFSTISPFGAVRLSASTAKTWTSSPERSPFSGRAAQRR